MQQTYIKQYINHFGLYRSGNKYFDKNPNEANRPIKKQSENFISLEL